MTIKQKIYLFILIGLTARIPAKAAPLPFQRGINLSGWFQYVSSASEIQFKRYTRQDLENIQSLGFDHIRLPVECFKMTGQAPDYQIDPLFFHFLDQVIDWTEALNLHLILDNHSFHPSIADSQTMLDQLVAVWAQLADHCSVRLTLYNAAGEKVDLLADDTFQSGRHQVIWDNSTQASGVYILHLQAGPYSAVNRLLVLY